MPLRDAPADLAEHRLGAAAARRAADERDHAEGARERAAVLDLDERPHPVEPRVRLHAADRAHVAGDGLDGLLDLARDDGDVRGQPGERRVREPGAASGHVDASVRARRTRGGLARLREALVRDAAGVHDRDVAASFDLAMPVANEPLAQRLRVGLGDLAAEEPDGEARHQRENLLTHVQVRSPAAVLDAALDPVALELRVVRDQVTGRDHPRRPGPATRARAPPRRRCSRARGRSRAARRRAGRPAERRSRHRCPPRSARSPRPPAGRSRTPAPGRSRASLPRSRGRRSHSRRRARCPAPRPRAARDRAASSGVRRCRRRGPDRSRPRSRRRRAPPRAGRSRAGRPGPACGTAASGPPSPPRPRRTAAPPNACQIRSSPAAFVYAAISSPLVALDLLESFREELEHDGARLL